MALIDSIFINNTQARESGINPKELSTTPALKLIFAAWVQSTLAHELTHSAQSRRSILEPGQFIATMEVEYEAYLREHFYIHEQLKVDPKASILWGRLLNYEEILDGLDIYLEDLKSHYGNPKVNSPSYQRYAAAIRTSWQAHRVEGYLLLAKRHGDTPFLSKNYLEKAQAAAKANGLPWTKQESVTGR
jgi:hypothetical protein